MKTLESNYRIFKKLLAFVFQRCDSFVLSNAIAVYRYGKRLVPNGGGERAGPSRLSDQSYLALHAEDYDDATDDTALLRPPQQPSDEGDLLS